MFFDQWKLGSRISASAFDLKQFRLIKIQHINTNLDPDEAIQIYSQL